MPIYNETLTEALSVAHTGAPLAYYGVQVAQNIGVSDPLADIRAQLPTLTDGVNVVPVLTPAYGLVMLEALKLAQTDIPNHKFNYALAELITINRRLLTALPVGLAETVTVASTDLAQRAVSVIEALGIGNVIAPLLKYQQTLTDQILVADALARFLGGAFVDSITVGETWTGDAFRAAQVAEALTIAQTQTPQFLIRVVAADTISIDDIDLPKLLFKVGITEKIEITAAYIGPNNSITTWAMNTRTGAVTEYDNFAFNSFAQLGGRYLGASDGGLYELAGTTDAGTSIVATIRSGFAQWSGSHLGAFKAAYLAVRGSGNFVLRVISGDGKIFNYSVTAQSMKSVKVNMGKGLRARYFAFELISTGQDFDLDSLEFIPLVAQRRV